MPTDQSSSPDVTTGTDQQTTETASNPDVKQDQTSSEPAKDVKQPDKTEDKQPDKWQTWDKIPISETLVAEIKKNTIAETERKLKKHYEPLVKTEDDINALAEFKKITQALGETLKPGRDPKEGFTAEELNAAIEQRNSNQMGILEKKISKKDAEVAEALNKYNETVEMVKRKEIRQQITTALNSSKDFRGELLEDALVLITYSNVFKCQDDMETVICVDPNKDGDLLLNPETADPVTPAEYVQEWLSDRPAYLKSSNISGMGGDYSPAGGGDSNPLNQIGAGKKSYTKTPVMHGQPQRVPNANN
jgi:hypothetical protein